MGDSNETAKKLLGKPSPKTWAESVVRAREVEETIKRMGQALDRRKCAVKRGVIETEVETVRGLVRI